MVTRYPTFDDLLGYCRLSANPVGRIVLHVFGAATAARGSGSPTWSAPRCSSPSTGRTWPRTSGQAAIYLPQRGPGRVRLHRGRTWPRRAASPQVRALIAFEVRRAAALLDAGAPLDRHAARLRPGRRWPVTWPGGRAALAAIAASGYDVLRRHAPAGQGAAGGRNCPCLRDGEVT